MTKKNSDGSWIAMDLEAGYCSGATVDGLDGMHRVASWEVTIPAPKKEIVWGPDRDTPLYTKILAKEAVDIDIKTENCWSARPLYLLFGAGTWSDLYNSGAITQAADFVPPSFAIQAYFNDTDKAISGCVMDEVSIVIPKEGGPVHYEWKAKGVDYGGTAAGTKPATETGTLMASDGTYSFISGINLHTVPDVFMGGKWTFNNNLSVDVPDLPNGRAYRPSVGNLGVKVEAEFRLDSDNSFSQPYEDGLTGIYNMCLTLKNSDLSGLVIPITGMQVLEFTEPVPTAEDHIVTQTVTFEQSEDFVMGAIQVTGSKYT